MTSSSRVSVPRPVNGAAAHTGHRRQIPDAVVQALKDLLLREGLAAEELLHLLLAGLRHGLAQLLVELLQNVHLVGGDGDLLTLALVVQLISLAAGDVQQGVDLLVLVPHGDHHGADVRCRTSRSAASAPLKSAALLVCLGDVDGPGHVALLQILPRLFGVPTETPSLAEQTMTPASATRSASSASPEKSK
jgi:hypothetical protein